MPVFLPFLSRRVNNSSFVTCSAVQQYCMHMQHGQANVSWEGLPTLQSHDMQFTCVRGVGGGAGASVLAEAPCIKMDTHLPQTMHGTTFLHPEASRGTLAGLALTW